MIILLLLHYVLKLPQPKQNNKRRQVARSTKSISLDLATTCLKNVIVTDCTNVISCYLHVHSFNKLWYSFFINISDLLNQNDVIATYDLAGKAIHNYTK